MNKIMFSVLAVAVMVGAVGFLIFNNSDDSEAVVSGSGIQGDPYTYVDMGADEWFLLDNKYIAEGAPFSVRRANAGGATYTILPYSGGHGLSLSGGVLSGTISGSGSFNFTVRETSSGVRTDRTITLNIETNTYTVEWLNWDITILETDYDVPYGTTPTYDGATPTRPATAQYSYTFSGWSPSVGPISDNMTYVAQYSATVNTYTVEWLNWDGSTLETDTNVPYGSTPTYDGATPTKPSDGSNSYIFTGWSPSVGPVTGNATYTAQYEAGPLYTVTWVNWDGSTLETDSIGPGVTPTYDGATPTRPATAQYSYTFTGWSPSVGPISGNTTYTAQYSATAIIYNLDDWAYTINDDFNAHVVGYTGSDNTVIMPSKFDNYTPVSIGAGAFTGNIATVLVIAPTIATISDNAFSGSGITDVINFSTVALNPNSYGLDNAVIHTSVPGWLYLSNADYTVSVEKTDTTSILIRLLPIVIVIGLVLYFVYRLRDREDKLY